MKLRSKMKLWMYNLVKSNLVNNVEDKVSLSKHLNYLENDMKSVLEDIQLKKNMEQR